MSEQRSIDWYQERLGKITASRVKRVMTGNRKTWASLMDEMDHELMMGAEWVMNRSGGRASDHGIALEPEAIAQYELIENIDVERVGFMLHPEINIIGASVDFLRPGDRAGEVKCPLNISVHHRSVIYGMPPEHHHQVQCQLAVVGLNRSDFVSYCPAYEDPDKRIVIYPQWRDDKYINKMIEMCGEFYEIYRKGKRPKDQYDPGF